MKKTVWRVTCSLSILMQDGTFHSSISCQHFLAGPMLSSLEVEAKMRQPPNTQIAEFISVEKICEVEV